MLIEEVSDDVIGTCSIVVEVDVMARVWVQVWHEWLRVLVD